MLQLEWSSDAWKVANALVYSESTTHSQEIGFDLLRAGASGFGTAVRADTRSFRASRSPLS